MRTSSTNYAANVVQCKLYGLVKSPTELIFGGAIFIKLSENYPGWKCRVYSDFEYREFVASANGCQHCGRSFAVVSNFIIPNIGEVDFAIFIPRLSRDRPVLVVECDGHEFHERTPEQASSDRRRDRMIQRWGVPVLRFTGTDVVRGSLEFAQEIADFINDHAFRSRTDNGEQEASATYSYQQQTRRLG
jgi:Protein of unknown function (DUF559)